MHCNGAVRVRRKAHQAKKIKKSTTKKSRFRNCEARKDDKRKSKAVQRNGLHNTIRRIKQRHARQSWSTTHSKNTTYRDVKLATGVNAPAGMDVRLLEFKVLWPPNEPVNQCSCFRSKTYRVVSDPRPANAFGGIDVILLRAMCLIRAKFIHSDNFGCQAAVHTILAVCRAQRTHC